MQLLLIVKTLWLLFAYNKLRQNLKHYEYEIILKQFLFSFTFETTSDVNKIVDITFP